MPIFRIANGDTGHIRLVNLNSLCELHRDPYTADLTGTPGLVRDCFGSLLRFDNKMRIQKPSLAVFKTVVQRNAADHYLTLSIMYAVQ